MTKEPNQKASRAMSLLRESSYPKSSDGRSHVGKMRRRAYIAPRDGLYISHRSAVASDSGAGHLYLAGKRLFAFKSQPISAILGVSDCAGHKLFRNFAIPSQVHSITFLRASSGGMAPFFLESVCTPIIGIPSSTAHCISHLAPSALAVCVLSNAITPSHPLMTVRHRVFHFSSNGSFIDMSVKEKGVFSFLAWPTRYSLAHLSSMAKLIKTRFLRAIVLSPCCSPNNLPRNDPLRSCFSTSAARRRRPSFN